MIICFDNTETNCAYALHVFETLQGPSLHTLFMLF
jgi:hypothetical protein